MFGKTFTQRVKEFQKFSEKNANEAARENSCGWDASGDDPMDASFDDDNEFGYDGPQFENIVNMEDINVERQQEQVKFVSEPLYENCRHTVTEFAMALMAVSRDKELSDASVNSILHLFRIFMPESNKVPSSYEKIKKIVKKESHDALLQDTITFCATCLNNVCTCNKMEKSFLLIFNVRHQLAELLSRDGVKMINYRRNMLEQDVLMDIHQSEYYRELLRKFPNMLPLSLYTDGGRYSKTGGYEGWPLAAFALDLPPKLRHKYSNIIMFGYWYSKKKPNWKFIFKNLETSIRFKFEDRDYCVKYLQVIADIPARQSLLSMINVQGYDSCFNCDIHGSRDTHLIYPYCEIHPRDPRTFIDKTFGVTGDSVLYELVELFPQAVTIDLMHSVYRGPLEDDIKRLLHGFKLNQQQRLLIKLNKENMSRLDSLILNMKFPKEYQRRNIRSLAVFSTWKASELKLFCLYVVPTALLFIGSSEKEEVMAAIESLIVYSCAIRILNQAKITTEMVTAADELLDFWAKNRALLWTDRAMTFKAHENRHLANQVLLHGPLCTHSAFAGESAIGRIGKNITCHNAAVSVKQIAERMALLRASFNWLDKYGHPKIKAHFNFNNEVVQNDKRIAEPNETVVRYLSSKFLHFTFIGEICINGFSICPFQTTDDTNCFIAVKTETGFKAVKVMAIVQTLSDEILFCGHPLNLLPYTQLLKADGILATTPFAYQYCLYGSKETFMENEIIVCNVQSFLAKYVMIEADSFCFFMTLPHPYEHN